MLTSAKILAEAAIKNFNYQYAVLAPTGSLLQEARDTIEMQLADQSGYFAKREIRLKHSQSTIYFTTLSPHSVRGPHLDGAWLIVDDSVEDCIIACVAGCIYKRQGGDPPPLFLATEIPNEGAPKSYADGWAWARHTWEK